MPTYEITSPDGKTFEVTAPDGATQDQVLAYAQQQFSKMPTGQPQPASLKQKVQASIPGRIVQGMRDPIDAGAQLLPRGLEFISSAGGLLPNQVSEYFGSEAKRVDQMNSDAERDYQSARTATGQEGIDGARIIGNIASPVNAGIAKVLPISPAMTATQKAVQGTLAGGAGGLLQPINDMKPGQSFAATKATQGVMGAVTGGIATPLMSKVGEVISRHINMRNPEVAGARASLQTDKVIAEALAELGQRMDDVPEAQMQALRQQVSGALKQGKQLDPAAILRKADADALGVQLTQGQLTRDASQFARERNLRGVAGVGEPLLTLFDKQNQQLQKVVGGARGQPSEAYPAGVKLAEALRNVDEGMRGKVSDLYKAARESSGKDLDVPLTGLAQDYAETLRNFGDKVPSGVRNRFEELGLLGNIRPKMHGGVEISGNQTKMFTIEDAESLLKVINDNVTNDRAANTALDTLRKAVKNAVVQADDQGGVFAAPRAAAAKRFELQEAIPALKAASEGTTAPDDFVQRFVLNGKTDNVKAMADLLRQSDASAFDEAKSQIGDKLFRSAFGNNTAGDKLFSPERYAEELRKIGTDKLKAFFTQAEIDKLKAAGRVGAYINSTPTAAPVNTSNTAATALSFAQKLPGVPASAALLSNAVRSVGNSRAVSSALNAKVPEKAAELTPEQIQLLTKLLSLGGASAGGLGGSSLR